MLELKKKKGVTKDGKEFDIFYVSVAIGKTVIDLTMKPTDYTSKDLLLLAFASVDGERK